MSKYELSDNNGPLKHNRLIMYHKPNTNPRKSMCRIEMKNIFKKFQISTLHMC